MNNFALIEQIHLRLPLWDKVYSEKTDANKREALWDEVAQVMDCSKEIVKSRWKNLRDSYRKIIRKSDTRDSDPSWPYYNAMDFMREITINARPKVMDITSKSQSLSEAENFLMIVRTEGEDSIDPLIVKQEKGLKRPASDDVIPADFLEEKLSRSEAVGQEEKGCRNFEDDDYQFLLSLLPHLKQVAGSRKLPLRMKIEQLIYEEVYHSPHGSNSGCGY